MRSFLTIITLVFAGAAAAQEVGVPSRGHDYAADHCVECHDIEPGQYGDPFMPAPGFEEIANTPGMSEVALFSFFQTSHPTMPNFVIETSDIYDLIAYIRSLKD